MLDRQGLPAQFAEFVGQFVFHLYFLDGRISDFQLLSQGLVERGHHASPIQMIDFDVVQALLQFCSETSVHDFFEVSFHQVVDNESKVRGQQGFFLSLYISSFDEGSDDGGIGAGTSNIFFFQFLDQTRL